ncbi:MAG: ABC transporter substrate-binding protein [Acidaminococcales bacterium]|jgi:NitT/TauT family transport system substrate-binding protein|nr:ABC transporter substrate-binding protein [Acidaminococcales bacterium]
MRKLSIAFLLFAAALLSAACGGQKAAPPAKVETKKMTIGLLRLTSSAPLFIGMDKGFFKEQGIELTAKWFDAAQPIAVATASNQVDVGATGITASLFNMIGSGQKLTIVADKGREEKGYPSSTLVVVKKLHDQGVTTLEQLKGKKIGITQKGSTFQYMIGRMLEAKGMSANDVEIVPLGQLGSILSSLRSGQIDAAILNEPNPTKAEKAGYAKSILPVANVIDYQTSGIFYSPNLNKDEELAVRFMKAYIKCCNYYYDAVLARKDGKPAPGANYDEVIKIIANYTNMPVEDIKIGIPYIDRNGRLLASDIDTQIKWYSKHKLLEKPVEAKEAVNTTFFDKALAK